MKSKNVTGETVFSTFSCTITLESTVLSLAELSTVCAALVAADSEVAELPCVLSESKQERLGNKTLSTVSKSFARFPTF